MKKSKIAVWILLGVVLIGCMIAALWHAASTVNHALRISELLQPVTAAKNQTMHIRVCADIGGESLALDSDVYMVTDGENTFLVLEQQNFPLYISGNVAFLENGKAFKLGEKMQAQPASYPDLLPLIGTLYNALTITAEETAGGTAYEITVTGEQVDALLAAASLEGNLPAGSIQKLKLRLTETDEALAQIAFSGSGSTDGAAVSLDVTLSGFRSLAAGDYPIPDAVRERAASVDPDDLFSLTDDLYRLVLALAPLAHPEALDGTLTMTADCSLLQLDTEMKLSDLESFSSGQTDPQQLQALPQMLGLMCLEGDISCTQKGVSYIYTLKLDANAMGQLARMILPELSQYSGNLTEGSVTVLLDNGAITSMEVTIEGKIKAMIVQIPITLSAKFSFQ